MRAQVGVVGLGKMGAIIAQRLLRRGIDVNGFDVNGEAMAYAEDHGVRPSRSLEEFVAVLTPPRLVWLMLPSGATVDLVLAELEGLLSPPDVVVEGGNSDFERSLEYAARYRERRLALLDVGVSGGIWGLEDGCGLLVGGSPEVVERCTFAFDAVASKGAWARVGPSGAGHYAKMVHNAIEYAVMQAYGEGYELLRAAPIEIDAPRTVATWNGACSIRAWLLGHLARALAENPDLDGIPGSVGDSGQGRWSVRHAVDQGVPVPAIAAAMFARFGSQQETSPALQAVAALRREVGGHKIQTTV